MNSLFFPGLFFRYVRKANDMFHKAHWLFVCLGAWYPKSEFSTLPTIAERMESVYRGRYLDICYVQFTNDYSVYLRLYWISDEKHNKFLMNIWLYTLLTLIKYGLHPPWTMNIIHNISYGTETENLN